MGRDERHGTKITKYTRVYFPSLPSHPLFYANPNSRPGVVSSLSSLHVLKQRGDRGTVNRQSISIGCFYAFGYTFKSLTPQFPASTARVHTERERSDAVISAYLHESLAATVCVCIPFILETENQKGRTKFVESLITLKRKVEIIVAKGENRRLCFLPNSKRVFKV